MLICQQDDAIVNHLHQTLGLHSQQGGAFASALRLARFKLLTNASPKQ